MSGIVGLGGGIGASRLWRVLARAVGPSNLTLVVNTGDDLRLHGLRICPDLDTTLYALSGRQDAERGWGLRDETFICMEALSGLGGPGWFQLGDRDLATHLFRTGLLADGLSLTEVTARLATALGSCRLTLAAGPGGDLRLDCADHDPFTRAVGAVATAIAEASVAGTWDRLKSCPGHLCGWAFYDRSPAGRSRWCSMQVCGSREKMRAYRGRPPA